MTKLIVATFLFAAIGNADIIKCSFTEPFISSTYSMTQSSLVYTDAEGTVTKIKNVSFQIKAAGLFELVDKTGVVLQILNLKYQGSDGMSDRLFPFDVKDSSELTHKGQGGCESNRLK